MQRILTIMEYFQSAFKVPKVFTYYSKFNFEMYSLGKKRPLSSIKMLLSKKSKFKKKTQKQPHKNC